MAYLNGRIVPLSEARISVLDYGFLFGYGLFETMRAYNGTVFRLAQHLDRLAASLHGLAMTADKSVLRTAVYDTLKANSLTDARVRLIMTIGEGSLTPDTRTCSRPTLAILAARYHPYGASIYENGWRVIVSRIRRNSQSPLPAMKSSNFLESMIVKREARAAGADDALMFNEKDLLAEASSSNVFLVSEGVLITPRLGSGLLPGITRSVVLELAEHLGIPLAETDITPSAAMNSNEAFLTNSMIEIMPVVEIDGRKVGDGRPGSITRRLMAAYARQVRLETG